MWRKCQLQCYQGLGWSLGNEIGKPLYGLGFSEVSKDYYSRSRARVEGGGGGAAVGGAHDATHASTSSRFED